MNQSNDFPAHQQIERTEDMLFVMIQNILSISTIQPLFYIHNAAQWQDEPGIEPPTLSLEDSSVLNTIKNHCYGLEFQCVCLCVAPLLVTWVHAALVLRVLSNKAAHTLHDFHCCQFRKDKETTDWLTDRLLHRCCKVGFHPRDTRWRTETLHSLYDMLHVMYVTITASEAVLWKSTVM